LPQPLRPNLNREHGKHEFSTREAALFNPIFPGVRHAVTAVLGAVTRCYCGVLKTALDLGGAVQEARGGHNVARRKQEPVGKADPQGFGNACRLGHMKASLVLVGLFIL